MNDCGRARRAPSALPPYRAILVVDVENFSGRPGRDQAALTEEIPRILKRAFVRCDRTEVLSHLRFQQSTGDGCVMGFEPVILPYLLNPFIPALQDELVDHDDRGGPVRMRVSVSVGPVTESELISAGSGDTRIEAHRLIDADPLRRMLRDSDPTTRVAAIVSVRAYEDAVRSGFAADSESLYSAVEVRVKSYRAPAYLRVPKPSGRILLGGVGEPDDNTAGPADPSSSETMSPEAGEQADITSLQNNSHGDNLSHSGHGDIRLGNRYGGDHTVVKHVSGNAAIGRWANQNINSRGLDQRAGR